MGAHKCQQKGCTNPGDWFHCRNCDAFICSDHQTSNGEGFHDNIEEPFSMMDNEAWQPAPKQTSIEVALKKEDSSFKEVDKTASKVNEQLKFEGMSQSEVGKLGETYLRHKIIIKESQEELLQLSEKIIIEMKKQGRQTLVLNDEDGIYTFEITNGTERLKVGKFKTRK